MTSVEIFGHTFPVACMLSRWKQCDAFRRCYALWKNEDCPDLPIVIEKYMPARHCIMLGKECILIGPKAFADGEVDTVSFYPWELNLTIPKIIP